MKWIQVLNPPIYFISLLPMFTLFLLKKFSFYEQKLLLGATVGVVLLQHGINVLNDVADWKRGADTEKLLSWVRYHAENLTVTSFHGYLSWILGSLLGIFILFTSHQLWILFFAFPVALLGFFYNAGKKPIAYTQYSEWVTALCYGPGVFGSLWLLVNHSFDAQAILGIISYAFLASAVLISHQPAQTLTDSLVQKNTFAVRYGSKTAITTAKYLLVLTLFFMTTAFVLSMENMENNMHLILWAVVLFFLTRLILIKDEIKPSFVLTITTLFHLMIFMTSFTLELLNL